MLAALSTTRAILNCPSSRTEPAMGTDVFLGNPEYGVDLHPIDFAAFANACGGVGFSVEDLGIADEPRRNSSPFQGLRFCKRR
jgi:hypothetical protein